MLDIPSRRNRGSFCFLLHHSSLIQNTEIGLPKDGHTACEDTPMLHRHKRKRKGRHERPESTAHEPRLRHGVVHSLEHSLWLRRFQREKRLHAEEVGVEEWCECKLVEDDLQG